MKPCSNKLCRSVVLVPVFCLGLICAGEKTESPPLYELDTPALAAKAEEGNAEAQYWLGSRYYSGRDGVAQDYTQAVSWLKKSVEKGNASAQGLLGFMYVAGSGISADPETGLELVQAAAAQTNRTAMYDLGTFYELGRGGLQPDRFEAMDWYIKAAAQGHSAAKKSLKGLREDADAFRMGTLSNEWWEISLEELTERAETGDADWQRRLGVRYKGYGGTPIDFEKARYWLEQSAAQTNLSAHYSLALLQNAVTNGSPEKAFSHCLAAAEGGYKKAQNLLGRYYRDGIGTSPDRKKALCWYEKAEKAGQSSASRNIYYLMQGQAADFASASATVLMDDYICPDVTFTVRDFNNQEASVSFVEYDVQQKSVKIKPSMDGVDTLPLSAFNRDGRAVIEGVAACDAFKKMSVRVRRKKMSKEDCEKTGVVCGKRGSSDYKYAGYYYDLSFRNRGLSSLEGLNVQYHFYYERESVVGGMFHEGPLMSEIQTRKGSLKVHKLAGLDECMMTTSSFVLESYDTDGNVYYSDGTPIMVDEKPEGLWVRVSLPAPGGVTVYRDFFEKSSLQSKVEW